MSDLISRKALEKAIRDYADEVGCNRGEYELANGILKSLSMVEKAPTAYDMDKVVEQLEGEHDRIHVREDVDLGKKRGLSLSIEIVKGGITS